MINTPSKSGYKYQLHSNVVMAIRCNVYKDFRIVLILFGIVTTIIIFLNNRSNEMQEYASIPGGGGGEYSRIMVND